VRLPAFGTLSPELRTLDDAAARLGRGTWRPQGPILGTALLVLRGFDGVRPSRPLVATQRSGGWSSQLQAVVRSSLQVAPLLAYTLNHVKMGRRRHEAGHSETGAITQAVPFRLGALKTTQK
jgi:hypothetical protein